jgi:hypothetical protein
MYLGGRPLIGNARHYWETLMHNQPLKPHLDPTQVADRDFFGRNIHGPVVMLNLMRFRTIAFGVRFR